MVNDLPAAETATGRRRRRVVHDLVWALILFELALVLGLALGWPLVRLGFRGELETAFKTWEKAQAAQRFRSIKTLDLAQTYAVFENHEALFIDARPAGEFRELHIPKALNITAEHLEQGMPPALAPVDKQQRIIVYCGTTDCHASLKVAELLQDKGFVNIQVFVGGFKNWDEAGYPVDSAL